MKVEQIYTTANRYKTFTQSLCLNIAFVVL